MVLNKTKLFKKREKINTPQNESKFKLLIYKTLLSTVGIKKGKIRA